MKRKQRNDKKRKERKKSSPLTTSCRYVFLMGSRSAGHSHLACLNRSFDDVTYMISIQIWSLWGSKSILYVRVHVYHCMDDSFPVGKIGWSVGNDENSRGWVTPRLFLGLEGERRRERKRQRQGATKVRTEGNRRITKEWLCPQPPTPCSPPEPRAGTSTPPTAAYAHLCFQGSTVGQGSDGKTLCSIFNDDLYLHIDEKTP